MTCELQEDIKPGVNGNLTPSNRTKMLSDPVASKTPSIGSSAVLITVQDFFHSCSVLNRLPYRPLSFFRTNVPQHNWLFRVLTLRDMVPDQVVVGTLGGGVVVDKWMREKRTREPADFTVQNRDRPLAGLTPIITQWFWGDKHIGHGNHMFGYRRKNPPTDPFRH